MASALAHLQRAVALQPHASETHYNYGVVLWYGGSKEKAISELRESVRLDPAAGASHAFLGTALRETGDLPAAQLSLQRAIALLPPLPATYIDLGIVFLRSRTERSESVAPNPRLGRCHRRAPGSAREEN
jgi:tetratricopeptide (TPR) repeat protein